MATNIHTDSKFEKHLSWLARKSRKSKTDIIKELVLERYHLKQAGFRFGALKNPQKVSLRGVLKELKKMDRDHDLD